MPVWPARVLRRAARLARCPPVTVGPHRASEKLKIPHRCSQPDAKKLLPPETAIWRFLIRSERRGHGKDHKRVTEPFLRHDGSSQLALLACLRKLRRQHGEKQGLSMPEHCPFPGLFSEAASSSSGS